MQAKTSTFRSRWLPQIVTVAVAGAAAVVGVAAGPGHGAQLADEELASPGKIRAVAVETARSGWPHPSTVAERDGQTRKVLAATVRRFRSGQVSCRWPGVTIARSRCRVRVFGGPGAGGAAVLAFTVRVRVFEDASWTMFRVR